MAPKAKAQKMSLGTFLEDETFGSWADEMEDMPIPVSDSRPGYNSSSRPSYGGASNDRWGSSNTFGGERNERGFSIREALPLPTEPPYTAHLGNLSFDATQADIGDFFVDCEVTNVRIVEDKLDRKPKGFGYVEFGSVEGLKKALDFNGTQFQGRNIRISVAEPPKGREDSRDYSDWSRKGPLPDLPGQRRVSDRPGRFEGSDAGTDGGRRPFEPAGDGKVRDFGNWERKGPLSPPVQAAASLSLREGGRQMSSDSSRFRKSSPAWGEGRSQDGSRPPRREFTARPPVERAPTAAEQDNQWRARMRPDAAAKSPETSTPSSPAPTAAPAPAGRPRLNLQKRTVSEAQPSPASEAAGSSIFGGAKPIDTSTREKEIEEKRQAAIQAKKEAEEKAKAERAEEKRIAKEKAKEEAEKAAEENKKPEGKSEENGEEIDNPELKQVDDDSAPVEDKAVKPKEIVRNAPPSKAAGSWRRDGPKKSDKAESSAPASPATPAESTAVKMEEDGWSTVPNRGKNSRRGGGRAIAS